MPYKTGKKPGNKKMSPSVKKMPATAKDDQDSQFGPRKAGNTGGYADDGAGTRSRAGLPPATVAMSAPKAELPKEATDMASPVLPVPSVDQPLIHSVEAWDLLRDRKLGNTRHGQGQ